MHRAWFLALVLSVSFLAGIAIVGATITLNDLPVLSAKPPQMSSNVVTASATGASNNPSVQKALTQKNNTTTNKTSTSSTTAANKTNSTNKTISTSTSTSGSTTIKKTTPQTSTTTSQVTTAEQTTRQAANTAPPEKQEPGVTREDLIAALNAQQPVETTPSYLLPLLAIMGLAIIVQAGVSTVLLLKVAKKKEEPARESTMSWQPPHDVLPEPLQPFRIPTNTIQRHEHVEHTPTLDEARRYTYMLRAQGHSEGEIRAAYMASGYSAQAIEEIMRL